MKKFIQIISLTIFCILCVMYGTVYIKNNTKYYKCKITYCNTMAVDTILTASPNIHTYLEAVPVVYGTEVNYINVCTLEIIK